MITAMENNRPAVFYILTCRKETLLKQPLCFSSFESACEQMERQYYDTLKGCNPNDYDMEDTELVDDCAVIAHKDGWIMWDIWTVTVDAPSKEDSI